MKLDDQLDSLLSGEVGRFNLTDGLKMKLATQINSNNSTENSDLIRKLTETNPNITDLIDESAISLFENKTLEAIQNVTEAGFSDNGFTDFEAEETTVSSFLQIRLILQSEPNQPEEEVEEIIQTTQPDVQATTEVAKGEFPIVFSSNKLLFFQW